MINAIFSAILGSIVALLGVFLFLIGYNTGCKGGKAIRIKEKKHQPTEEEELLDRINKATL